MTHLVSMYGPWGLLCGPSTRGHSARLWLTAAWRGSTWSTGLLTRLSWRLHLLLLLHLQRDLVVEDMCCDKHVRVLPLLHSLLVRRYVLLCVIHRMHHDIMPKLHELVFSLRVYGYKLPRVL